MKRFLFYLLISFSLFSIASCGDDDDDDSKQTTPSNNDKPEPVETKTFTVTFNVDGGSEVAAQTVEDGKSATKPEDPAKDRFNFEGWFNGESLYDFASPVTSDLTLTAQWIKNFTVTFNTNGGSEVSAQTVEDGKSATKPEDPTKEGFWFLGWYVGENVYEFTQPVSDDLTVTAKWMEKTEYDVDLGLPSGTIWASCNVGAQNPWDYGDYFSWGEVTTKDVYDEDTYTYRDSPSTLDASHDAATVNMGSNWRMPTVAEFVELRDNCEWEWTDDYNGKGVSGYIVWDKYFHKTHIFLPAAGYRYGSALDYAGSFGDYWSSSVYDSDYAWELGFYSGARSVYYDNRHDGQTVRAVRCRN